MAIKRFKAYISEESTGEKLEPKAQGEKDFKAKHSIETTKHPVAGDHQFNGDRAEITEGKVKDQMVDDSETMSKKDFIKKYGKEYADDLYEVEDDDSAEDEDDEEEEVEEGSLPPALQKAIDKKNGKKSDEDEDLSEGAVVDQLNSIISKKSAKKVKFGNGKVEEIDMTTAAALVNMLEKLKPANKVKAEKMLEKSPEGMFQLLDVAFGGK
jgi:hypothetical protein|tara:strand:+ start:2977 stop:3609 length:633 start_codon:yes stop_codon:yes gene_type:complete